MFKGTIFFLVTLLVCVAMTSVSADTALKKSQSDTRYDINIPSLNAIEAFSRLADQTGAEFLYPYDLVKTRTTQKVVGKYSTIEALTLMLENSGLSCGLSEKGSIKIFLSDSSSTQNGERKKMNKRKSLFAGIGAALISIFTQTNVAAQELESEKTNTKQKLIEEIVITATKRGTTSLSDAAFSVRALSEEMLENRNVQDFTDFAPLVPGLISEDQGPGERRYVIRGIRAVGPATVGVYWDEAVITGFNSEDDGGGRNVDFRLFDLERVEVLRGPQGTLYGASSMSGTIKYVTNKPSTESVHGKVGVEVSSTEEGGANYVTHGIINIPITDSLAIRGVAWHEDNEGFIDDIGTARILPTDPGLADEDVNGSETTGGRVAARWQVNDALLIDASAVIQRSERGRCLFWEPQLGDLNCDEYVLYGYDDESELYQVSGNYTFDSGTLTVGSSFFDRRVSYGADCTSTLLRFGIPLGCLNIQDEDRELWSNEIRFASDFDSPFNMVVGAFYSHLDRTFTSDVWSTDNTGVRASDEVDVFGRAGEFTVEEVAVFGEFTYEISDKWTAVFGARYYDFSQDSQNRTTFPFGGIPGGPVPPADPEVSAGDDKFTIKASLMYEVNDNVNLYALYSEGFRQGGTNAQGFGVTIPAGFSPDSIENYEFGAKISWMDNRYTLNASVYRIDWANIQTLQFEPVGGFEFIGNASEATVDGIELEFFAIPDDHWDFTVSSTLLDARLTADQPSLPVVVPVGLDGDPIPFVPSFTIAVAAQYNFELNNNFTGFVRADWNYQGESQTQFNRNGLFFNKQPSYDVLDVRLVVRNGGWEAALFLDNALDERAVLRADETFLEPVFFVPNKPRTFGGSVSYSWE